MGAVTSRPVNSDAVPAPRRVTPRTLFVIAPTLIAGFLLTLGSLRAQTPPAASAAPPATSAQATTQAAADWPQFRGNPKLTGMSTESVPSTLKVRWTYSAADAVDSSAAIVGDTVYIGSHSGELLALDVADGKLKWSYKTKEPIGESSPAVSDGLVFVGDLGGTFHAVKAADGTAAWTYKTQSEIKSSPVVVGDRVLIGSYDSSLYALSKKDGKLLWKLDTQNFVHGTPAIDGEVAYLAGCDEIFRAIRLSDGQPVYTVPIEAYTGASVTVGAGRVFFGTFNNEVVGLDLSGKRIFWRYQPTERQFPFYSSAAFDGTRLVLGGRDKAIHALDAKTGKPLWTFPTRARVDSSPAIAGGRAFVGSNDGRFYMLDLASGKKLWDHEAGSPIASSPAIGRGCIIVGTQDGQILCYGA